MKPWIASRPDLSFLLIGALAIAGALVSQSGSVMNLVAGCCAVAGTASIFLGIRRYCVRPRWPWILAGFSLALFCIEGAVRFHYDSVGSLLVARSYLPDILEVPCYISLFAALIGVARRRTRGISDGIETLLTGLMVSLSLFVVVYIFVLGPILEHRHTTLFTRIDLVANPPLSLFAVVIAVRLAGTSGRRNPLSFWYLLGAVASLLLGDTVYFLANVRLVIVPVSVLVVPYILAYLFSGACALHPSMVDLMKPDRDRDLGYRRWQIALVGISLLIPAVVNFASFTMSVGARTLLVIIEVALVLAATARVALALLTERSSKDQVLAQAYVDHLTGLPNRLRIEQVINDVLATQEREDSEESARVAVIFLDLDQFKVVNDTFGHASGDIVLTTVAERLRSACRGRDVVGRLGGDEFVVVLAAVADLDAALEVARAIRRELAAPIWVDDTELYISASIGVAIADEETSHSAELVIRDADTAMYTAKARGRDAIVTFDAEMRSSAARRLELQNDLRHALERNELSLVFQPIVSTLTGAVQGVEALLRWNHPQFGPISPALFVPLAEESGHIATIGTWVLDHALAEFASWKRLGGLPVGFFMAINLSALQLLDETLPFRVSQLLDTHGILGSEVCLELTESVVMDNIARASAILGQLRERDIHIAIDDFGSGYSSLAYLGRLPVNKLKIDKGFIDQLEHDDTPDETLIAAIVAMAESLGMSTVAEGVETATQARRVRELGCDSIQGYLFSRPVRGKVLLEVIVRLQGSQNEIYADSAKL